MASASSRWGFSGQASKQLAGEREPFKRQGDKEILIRRGYFPTEESFLQPPYRDSLTVANLLCLISHRRQFSEGCYREKRGDRKWQCADRKWGEIRKKKNKGREEFTVETALEEDGKKLLETRRERWAQLGSEGNDGKDQSGGEQQKGT